MTKPLPRDATWTDYVNAHGGSEASGWWVTLRWYADSEHPRPEVVGPYSSHRQAVAAMQDSLLIDGFAEDTNREEWLDDVYVDPVPVSIARMCADHGNRVTLVDPDDPNHFGDLDSELTAPDRSGRLQAGALHAARPQTNGPAAGEGPRPAERSPGPPGV